MVYPVEKFDDEDLAYNLRVLRSWRAHEQSWHDTDAAQREQVEQQILAFESETARRCGSIH